MGHRINGGPNTNDPRVASEMGSGFLMNQGYTMVWNGWQADVSSGGGRMRGEFPIPTQTRRLSGHRNSPARVHFRRHDEPEHGDAHLPRRPIWIRPWPR